MLIAELHLSSHWFLFARSVVSHSILSSGTHSACSSPFCLLCCFSVEASYLGSHRTRLGRATFPSLGCCHFCHGPWWSPPTWRSMHCPLPHLSLDGFWLGNMCGLRLWERTYSMSPKGPCIKLSLPNLGWSFSQRGKKKKIGKMRIIHFPSTRAVPLRRVDWLLEGNSLYSLFGLIK